MKGLVLVLVLLLAVSFSQLVQSQDEPAIPVTQATLLGDSLPEGTPFSCRGYVMTWDEEIPILPSGDLNNVVKTNHPITFQFLLNGFYPLTDVNQIGEGAHIEFVVPNLVADSMTVSDFDKTEDGLVWGGNLTFNQEYSDYYQLSANFIDAYGVSTACGLIVPLSTLDFNNLPTTTSFAVTDNGLPPCTAATPALTIATGLGLEKVVKGSLATFNVKPEDLACSGVSFEVTVTKAGDPELDGTKRAVEVSVSGPNADGSFDYSYRPTQPGAWRVRILLDGVHIAGSPFKVKVSPK